MQVPVGFCSKHLRQLGMNRSPVPKTSVKYLQIQPGLNKGGAQGPSSPDSFSSIGTHVSKGQVPLLRCSFSSPGATSSSKTAWTQSPCDLNPQMRPARGSVMEKDPPVLTHSRVRKQRQGGISVQVPGSRQAPELLNHGHS